MAIVALVFMAIFTVSLVLCFAMPTALNHGFGYITLFSGFVGIAVFIVIKLSDRAETKTPQITVDDKDKPEDGEKDNPADKEETGEEDGENKETPSEEKNDGKES